MKRGRVRLWCLCLAGLILLAVSGPGAETTGVENLLLIRSVAVDGTGITADTGLGESGEAPEILEGIGDSISAAVKAISYNSTGKCPFFSHTENIVLGSETLDGNLHPSLDWMVRSMEIRLDTLLWCVREGSAGDLLRSAGEDQSSLSDSLELLGEYAAAAELGRTYTVGEVMADLLEKGWALIPALEAGEKPTPAGYAVIGKNGLLGLLGPECAQGIAMRTDVWEPRTLYLPESGVTLLLTWGKTGMTQYETYEKTEVSVKCSVLQMDREMSLEDTADREKIISEAENTLRQELIRAASALGNLTDSDLGYSVNVQVSLTRTYDKAPSGGQ